VAAPLGPGQELGVVGRLINVFVSPSKTFESINRKPGWDWLVPFVLICGAVFLFQSVALPKIDIDEAVAQQMRMMEKMNPNIPDAQKQEIEEKAREGMEKQFRFPSRLIYVPILLGFYFLIPAIYLAGAAMFGKANGYMKLVSGYVYTQTVQIIPILLGTAVAFAADKLSSNDVQFYRVLKSNVGAYLDFDTTHKGLLGLLSSVDVFDIWAFVVGSIAVSKLTRFSPKGALALVGTCWALYTLLKVALGTVWQAFTG